MLVICFEEQSYNMLDNKQNQSKFLSVEIRYKISVKLHSGLSVFPELWTHCISLTVDIVTCSSLSEVSHKYSSLCLNIKSQMDQKIINR